LGLSIFKTGGQDMFKKLVVWMLILPFLGCATIIGKGGPESLNIRSTPDQACAVK
jgi:hypothetical protein